MKASTKTYITEADYLAVEVKLEPETKKEKNFLDMMHRLGVSWGSSISRDKGKPFVRLPGITIMTCAPLPGARKE
jgi:hypothetical protein